ncbi:TlpA disulfide reductase family protein [Aliiglaciecola sp. LCG003]|uniref:TlpA family protein disulfide reductase n=1 Tax=Aliiglaciecola sp. LCG003 TaxID=3053655 RepID=UPI0025737F18|nr:TlpA disulfide reductase family protein [Aliiglaciecola sp. LCG003]WJG10121.1 TlpA disulfide reductase family protein [Aliiglaciecola sp. LCG003]
MPSRIILLSCLCLSLMPWHFAFGQLNTGDSPPNYLGNNSQDQQITLENNKGKVVIISFWASWCAPCIEELPVLEAIQSKIGKDKIHVVAINYKESRKKYRRIRKQLSTLSLTMTHDVRGQIGDEFGVEGIPHLFIVGKDGKLIFQNVGYGESSIDKIINVLNSELSS